MRYDDRTESENLTGDEAKVARLLRDLRRVNSPPDFELRLKARIAGAVPPVDKRSGFILGFRFAIPVVVVLLLFIGGFFVFIDQSGSDVADTATGSEGTSTPPLPEPAAYSTPAILADSNGQETVKAQVDQTVGKPDPPRQRLRPRTTPVKSEQPAGGSVDRALTISNRSILPVDPDSTTEALPQNKPVSSGVGNLSGVLGPLGIDAEFRDGAWKVRSVKAGSSADRAGVIAGDVIDAVDDQSVTGAIANQAAGNIRAISVLRKGQRLELVLGNK